MTHKLTRMESQWLVLIYTISRLRKSATNARLDKVPVSYSNRVFDLIIETVQQGSVLN